MSNPIQIIDNVDAIQRVGSVIMQYEAYQNSFIDALVNRIGMAIVTSKTWDNPWARFKKGTLEMGETVEEIFANIGKVHSYDPHQAESEWMKREMPDVRAAFHRLNFQKFYKVTIQEYELRQAFIAWQEMTDLIARVTSTLYTGMNLDEFTMMKYMICRAVLNAQLHYVSVTAQSTDPKDAVKKMRAYARKMTYLTNEYNQAGVYNATPYTENYIFIDADYEANMDVEVLAAAFNMDKAEFIGHLIVVDSIQTMETEAAESAPGSVTQIRECTAALLRYAKTSGVPVILIGHINKEGTIAGPKILEHIVDAVIQFEGDRQGIYRILRSIKNRFGSTSELGIYEMQQNGLRPVSNPSELLLSDDREGMSGVAIAAAVEGMRPFLVETQALVSTAAYGTPQRSATGFDQRRLNMLLAVLEKRVGFKLAQKDVFLNIAGGLKVTDMAMDLSVIAAVLSSNVDTPIESGYCMCGEVGLSGEVRPVTRIEQRIAEAEKLGFTDIIVPYRNKIDKTKFNNINIHPVRKVEEALRELFG